MAVTVSETDAHVRYNRIIARAWADPAFKQALLSDPAATLAAEGLPTPAGVELKVVENTPTLVHLILPAKPDAELSDDELDGVSGGYAGFGYAPPCFWMLPGGG